ncbi:MULTISPECIES: hypothetical protein [Aeromonas]|uniref:hypothetical protein n=1 Tax=Aeromonas TaxID=642 RepID=UPI00125ED503|nr:MULTISPECIES: hypothetical protein [Aeromonas]MDX7838045.1 hypothetical protein [Aeromonas caviae]
MLKKLNKWWEGEVYYIENVLPGIRYKRHWTAKVARKGVEFYLKNWQWCWGFLVAVSGLIIAYKKLVP